MPKDSNGCLWNFESKTVNAGSPRSFQYQTIEISRERSSLAFIQESNPIPGHCGFTNLTTRSIQHLRIGGIEFLTANVACRDVRCGSAKPATLRLCVNLGALLHKLRRLVFQ